MIAPIHPPCPACGGSGLRDATDEHGPWCFECLGTGRAQRPAEPPVDTPLADLLDGHGDEVES